MRIDFNYEPQAAPEVSRPSNQAGATEANSAVPSALGEDKAQLSRTHAQVEAYAAQAAQLPEVRQERVAALRESVQSGRYHVSHEKVAAAILVHMSGGPTA
jgi:flagellar biosynthesis anti-sigma factor FlgM